MNVYIIAEAGVNHNGSLEMAFRMVDEAKAAGVDYVKFQTGNPKLDISRYAPKADYQKVNTGKKDESQLDMCMQFHLSPGQYLAIKEYCNKIGIKFISTPFDLEAIDILSPFGMDFWKIPSGEITNYPYLVKIANTHMPVVMSTGMCEMYEIEDTIKVLCDNGLNKEQISLLHCNTEYPTPMSDVNLKAMDTLRRHFGMKVGYSDHTVGIEVPIAAVAMGAEIIEKHFTLDKTLPGPDHVASIEPHELKDMVKAIRNIEEAIGTEEKKVSLSESKNIAIARKSIVAARYIKQGEFFTEYNLTIKRPGTGINPMRWREILGMEAKRDFEEDELIEL